MPTHDHIFKFRVPTEVLEGLRAIAEGYHRSLAQEARLAIAAYVNAAALIASDFDLQPDQRGKREAAVKEELLGLYRSALPGGVGADQSTLRDALDP